MSWRNKILLFLAACVLVGGYLLASQRYFRPGFPLDDAWIHQTFARNLAANGEWSFQSGQNRGGSTSPLWTLLQTAGYFLRLSPVLWSAITGGAALFLTAVLCEQMWRQLLPTSRKPGLPLMGLLIVSEWHLVWASLSGMETILFILVICLVLRILILPQSRWLLLGLLAGAAVWIRPDGISLAGPVLFIAAAGGDGWKKSLLRVIPALVGLALALIPYFLFNFWLAGSILPNTYFAKQAEYASVTQTPLVFRWLILFGQIQVGLGLALFPGFVAQCIRYIRLKHWWGIASVLWVLGYILIFAIRLPVTYQHARYLMPVIPVYLLTGFAGVFMLIRRTGQEKLLQRVIQRGWLIIIAATAAGFYVLGGQAYVQDVAIIESEMVDASLWISTHTSEEALIAAHDIGALGYYSGRSLLDLAGLVNPEVIPLMRDEQALVEYMQAKGAEYLLTFPGVYPYITRQSRQVYSTQGTFSPDAGGENMTLLLIE